MKYLVNASNLHVGGGVQVASSFVRETMDMVPQDDNLFFYVSDEVFNNICSSEFDFDASLALNILNVHGFFGVNWGFGRDLAYFDSVFTVFGPLYTLNRGFRSVVGFAQPWIIYPNNECYRKLSFVQKIKTRLKYWIQGFYFKRADMLVVELEHVKLGLIRELNIPAERICVVHNCISSIFLEQSKWQPVYVPDLNGFLRIGFLGRNYLHKNTGIFPIVADILERDFGLRVRFLVTFTEQEWGECSPEFRSVCVNVGPLLVAQCPSFYMALDAVIFPSLLECFSATPLEAMVMQKPLFVSDRPFNRDVCGSHAIYFDPLCPYSAAQVIANSFSGTTYEPERLVAAREHAISFSSPKERAEKYIKLLTGKFSPNNL